MLGAIATDVYQNKDATANAVFTGCSLSMISTKFVPVLCSAVQTVQAGIFVPAAYAVLNPYNKALECLRENNTSYSISSEVIAISSPPLPFTNTVFVRSIPEGFKIGSYSLSAPTGCGIRGCDPAIAPGLESIVPNAIATWESYSNNVIIPSSIQIDGGFGTISASSATINPAPICGP